MAFAPEAVSFDRGDASILGGFYEKERGNWFEFSHNNDDFDFARPYPHKIWVTTPREGIDSGYRYGTVKKTVVYIVVDEDDAGKPVIEKWELKQNSLREYEAR
jgi:hypothetical protein